MRELFAAVAVVAVLVGGAFLLPIFVQPPAPIAPQRTAEISVPVPANNPVERPAVQNRTTAPESAVHPRRPARLRANRSIASADDGPGRIGSRNS